MVQFICTATCCHALSRTALLTIARGYSAVYCIQVCDERHHPARSCSRTASRDSFLRDRIGTADHFASQCALPPPTPLFAKTRRYCWGHRPCHPAHNQDPAATARCGSSRPIYMLRARGMIDDVITLFYTERQMELCA